VLHDGTPLDVPVASSLTEFLEHWLRFHDRQYKTKFAR
jgi:hypothetical protein